MTFLKYFQYVYLVFALYFTYDAITKYMREESYILSIFFAVAALGMFFFRRNFANKHKNRQ